jgi:hypothetical protein
VRLHQSQDVLSYGIPPGQRVRRATRCCRNNSICAPAWRPSGGSARSSAGLNGDATAHKVVCITKLSMAKSIQFLLLVLRGVVDFNTGPVIEPRTLSDTQKADPRPCAAAVGRNRRRPTANSVRPPRRLSAQRNHLITAGRWTTTRRTYSTPSLTPEFNLSSCQSLSYHAGRRMLRTLRACRR